MCDRVVGEHHHGDGRCWIICLFFVFCACGYVSCDLVDCSHGLLAVFTDVEINRRWRERKCQILAKGHTFFGYFLPASPFYLQTSVNVNLLLEVFILCSFVWWKFSFFFSWLGAVGGFCAEVSLLSLLISLCCKEKVISGFMGEKEIPFFLGCSLSSWYYYYITFHLYYLVSSYYSRLISCTVTAAFGTVL